MAVGGAVAMGLGWSEVVGSYLLTNTAMGVGFAACGVVVARHRPANPIGWLFLAFGVAHLTTAASTMARTNSRYARRDPLTPPSSGLTCPPG